jgi:hypothetical protein
MVEFPHPSTQEITNGIYAQSGIRGFFEGALLNAARLTITTVILTIFDSLLSKMDEKVPPPENNDNDE